MKLLPFHIIGPMIENYEKNCAILNKEIKITK